MGEVKPLTRDKVPTWIQTMILQLLLALLVPLSSLATEEIDAHPGEKVRREDEFALKRYRPFYFAFGNPLSKLQISFQTPIFRDRNFYFAYTQIMFWALKEHSKPFRDLTYNPEIFYKWRFEKRPVLNSIDFGIYGHNSNGKDGSASRSYDSQFIRFNDEFEGSRWLTRLSLQFSYLHNFDETNRDIQTYVSPLQIQLTFIQLFEAWFDKTEVSATFSPGGKFANRWDRGGYQLSTSFRLGLFRFVPAFYLQYYHGYAETLLNYDQHVDEFRGGFIF